MKKISIGGQALIEGIMMKSPEKTAMAVRTPNKSIDIEYIEDATLEDVFETDYYAKAVAWACTQGIVHGLSDTIFAPNALVKYGAVASVVEPLVYQISLLAGLTSTGTHSTSKAFIG